MENIEVAIRLRPLQEKELKQKLPVCWKVDKNTIYQLGLSTSPFTFDHVFNTHKSNIDIFNEIIKPLVKSSVEGCSNIIFMYGQTSFKRAHSKVRGIVSLATRNIFEYINNIPERKFILRFSYLEMYNIFDLLDQVTKTVQIHDDRSKYMNVVETIINSEEEVYKIFENVEKQRKDSYQCDKSHIILRIIIESVSLTNNENSYESSCVSYLNFVDLAEIGQISQTTIAGQGQYEEDYINKSLHSFHIVMQQLSVENHSTSSQDSKLTQILNKLIAENVKIVIIGTISPISIDESASTLRILSQIKEIKDRPVINKIINSKTLFEQKQNVCNKVKCKTLEQENIVLKVKITELEKKLEEIQKEYLDLNSQFTETTNTLIKTEDKLLAINQELDFEEKERKNLQKQLNLSNNLFSVDSENIQNNMDSDKHFAVIINLLTDLENVLYLDNANNSKLAKELQSMHENNKQRQLYEESHTHRFSLERKVQNNIKEKCCIGSQNYVIGKTRNIISNNNYMEKDSVLARRDSQEFVKNGNVINKKHRWWQINVKRLQSEIEYLDNEITTMLFYMQDLIEIITVKNKKIEEIKMQHEISMKFKKRRSAAYDSARNLKDIEDEKEEQFVCLRCKTINSAEVNRLLERQLRRKNMEIIKLETSLHHFKLNCIIPSKCEDFNKGAEYHK